MNKNRKMVIVLLFAFVVCFSLSGCTLQDRIEEYSSDKEQCYLNTENVTRCSYKGNDYTGLADIVSIGGRGDWIYPAACRHRRERKNIAARKC